MCSIAATLVSNWVLARVSSRVAAFERFFSRARASSRAAIRSRRFPSVSDEGASDAGDGWRIVGGQGRGDGESGDGVGRDGGGGGGAVGGVARWARVEGWLREEDRTPLVNCDIMM